MKKITEKVLVGIPIVGLLLIILTLSTTGTVEASTALDKDYCINMKGKQDKFILSDTETKPGTTDTKIIYTVDDTFTWLREPLIMRLPDGSLFCEIFTGGTHDGDKGNVVAAVRSDDDGQTWSDIEVIKLLPDTACWASAVFADNDRGYIFYYTLQKGRRHMDSEDCRLLYTESDGRTFTGERLLTDNWEGGEFVDFRRDLRLRNGKTLFPVAWKENVSVNPTRYVGVAEANSDFTRFNILGKRSNGSIGLFENQLAELSDGSLAMLMRLDRTNRIWRCDSYDGGVTWSEPWETDIPNPGSKFLLINLPDGRIVLFNNPNEKNNDDTSGPRHKHRTPLEMWVSDDDMKTWRYKETLAPASDGIAMYPDGFYDEKNGCIYVVWENEKSVFFKKIKL